MSPEHVSVLKAGFPHLWNDAISDLSDAMLVPVENLLLALDSGFQFEDQTCEECEQKAAGLFKNPHPGRDRYLCAKHILAEQVSAFKEKDGK